MLKYAGKLSITALLVVGLVIPQSKSLPSAAEPVFSPIMDSTPAQLTLELMPQQDVDPVEPELEQELEPDSESVDCSKLACIALTFDDGPDQNTLKILASLNKRGAKATFFVVGTQVRANPEIAKAIVDSGHEIGAHSYSHKRLTRLGNYELEMDFGKTNKLIREATGVEPKTFRPPYGIHSPRVREAAGLPTVMWSVDPQDWRTRSSRQSVRWVLNHAEPGAIVVMHDPLISTVNALPVILRELTERGYHFVTVSDLIQDMQPGEIYRARK
jgi:peptidoglycan/xylan/chitin deacetylase (PgdA/CDA1 family)